MDANVAQDAWRRSLGDPEHQPELLIDRRVERDAPSSILDLDRTPTTVVSGGNSLVFCLTTMTDWRIGFLENTDIALQFFALPPEVPHVQRLEGYGAVS